MPFVTFREDPALQDACLAEICTMSERTQKEEEKTKEVQVFSGMNDSGLLLFFC